MRIQSRSTVRSARVPAAFARVAMAAIGLAVLPFGAALAQSQVVAAPVPNQVTSNNSSVTHLIGPGMPAVDASQSVRTSNNHEFFQVLGFSGQVVAPVASPYDSSNTYRTFAGQPGRGSTAILAQSMDGAP